jgi:class 3 adenylate cyclase
MRRFSIRSKILLVVLVAGLACLGAGGMIGYRAGDEALSHSIAQRLAAERDTKRQQIESYIGNQLRLTAGIGGAHETIDAATAFIAAVQAMRSGIAADPAAEQADDVDLASWYRQDFIPRLDKVTGGHQSLEGLLPADPVARHLQADYIARNPHPAGERDQLVAAPGAAAYNAVHARFHPLLKRLADTGGFYDINLIDAQTGDVVYTVVKETDFGSNLFNGPYAQSGLANAVRKALDPRNGGKAVIEDYTPYVPSALAPQMFTAIPIVVDGRTLAVFAAQVDIKALNDLVTDDGQWVESGQGETGEVILVGQDRLLRSQSRFMTEDPAKFLDEAQANGLPAVTAAQIRNLGTTILYMPANTEAIELAFSNKTGLARYRDYRGIQSIAAFGPLEIGGLRWAVAAKQDVAEALAPEARLRRNLLTAAALAAVLLTFLALASAAGFTRPLRRVLVAMRLFNDRGELSTVPVQDGDEFGELARGYNAMSASIGTRDQALAEADQDRSALLRMIYPEAIAERMRNGAEITAETVSNATVAVAIIDGLDGMAGELDVVQIRDRLDVLLNALGRSAATHGVEPVRSLGEIYVGICGLSSPRLDHAARALAWTRTASGAVEQLGQDWDVDLSLRFGLASGDVDVLLLRHGHSAFDVWGHTLNRARAIAQGVPAGHVAVDDSTHRLLSDVQGFEKFTIETGTRGERAACWKSPNLARAVSEAGP